METATRDDNGLLKVWSSSKPHGTVTYFTGVGDDVDSNPQVIGGGAELIFNLSANDSIKTVDIEFTEDVWIKDGYALMDQLPPLGAYMNVFVVHPTYGIVGSFGRKIWLVGGGEVVLNTDDRSMMAEGLILRVEIHNSDGIGYHDPAAAFIVTGRIELFRANTV